jgi:hypothetical protein
MVAIALLFSQIVTYKVNKERYLKLTALDRKRELRR